MYLSTEQFVTSLSYPVIPRYDVETLLEKGSGALNEDVLLQADHLFGVFDGATSLDRRKFTGQLTGGLLAARIAAETFREGDDSLAHLADQANRRIRRSQRMENIPLSERHRLWSTSLAVIRLAGERFEYCQTGDALILLVLDDGGFRLVTPQINIDRETLQLWKESQATQITCIHELLADQIHRVRLQMNIGYGVLNGEPEAMNFLCHGYQELAGVSDILLFTDGLFLPRENPLDCDDWQLLVDLYRHDGLQAVRDHVRRLQQEDPTCRKYPRFKQHDDIAAVAIQFHNSPQPASAFS